MEKPLNKSDDFQSALFESFAAEWRARYRKTRLFGLIFFVLPGAAFVLVAIAIYFNFEWALKPIGGLLPIYFILLYEVRGILLSLAIAAFLFAFLPAGVLMSTAPKALSKVADELIERCELQIFLFEPFDGRGFNRSKLLEHLTGIHRFDANINESMSRIIWWLSSQLKPPRLADDNARCPSAIRNHKPYALAYPGRPVGRLGTALIRQWFFYFAQFLSWSVYIGLFSIGPLVAIYLVYRVSINVHTLAYAAAYYRILTERWPWEELAAPGAERT